MFLTKDSKSPIKSPKLTRKHPVFISDIELQSIIGKTSEQFLKDLFLTAFYTVMRAAELLNMQWKWIDFNKNLITIKCTSTFSTKSKKERVISISPGPQESKY